jgi:hypothetical protein
MFSESVKNLTYWLALLGVPGIFTIVVFMFKTLMKAIQSVNILQKAQKAQMRSQLLKQYEEYMGQEYIEQIYLDDWINQYNAYHQLVGANAVLDARKDDLIKLPNKKPKK